MAVRDPYKAEDVVHALNRFNRLLPTDQHPTNWIGRTIVDVVQVDNEWWEVSTFRCDVFVRRLSTGETWYANITRLMLVVS